jgi:hypothetical protein
LTTNNVAWTDLNSDGVPQEIGLHLSDSGLQLRLSDLPVGFDQARNLRPSI